MRILVTGATGSVGRLVVDALAGKGVTVRALTVDPDRAALPPEAEVAVGYIGDPPTLEPALEGVDRMYLAPAPETVEATTALAAAAGIERIVDLSGEPDSWWHGVAAAVEASGVGWVHLWPGEFMENMLIWADQIRETGEVRDGYPQAASAPIAMADVASVAATALLSDDFDSEALTLTGPETLTRHDMVAHIGAALGVEIPFIHLEHEEAVAQLTSVMGEYSRWYVDGLAELLEYPHMATATVQEVTGSPATSFAEWARLHADEFR